MARAGRSSRRGYRETGREVSGFANRRLPLSDLSLLAFSGRSFPLNEIEDRRTWHPQGDVRPARRVLAPASRFRVVRPVSTQASLVEASSVPISVGFQDARRVLVCVRRKQRREVLFAKGYGGAGTPPRRFSEYSKISCR